MRIVLTSRLSTVINDNLKQSGGQLEVTVTVTVTFTSTIKALQKNILKECCFNFVLISSKLQLLIQ